MNNNFLEKKIKAIDQDFDSLQKDYNVKKIGVFGSVVRNKQTRKSDIDILVEFSRPIGFFQFIELENHLSKILRQKVDLVTKNALKPIIKKEILKEVVYV